LALANTLKEFGRAFALLWLEKKNGVLIKFITHLCRGA